MGQSSPLGPAGTPSYRKGRMRMATITITNELSTDDKYNIKKIILENDAEILVNFAKIKTEQMVKRGLTRSQLRNVFGEFRKIEAFWDNDNAASERRLLLLKPKLVYQRARKPKETGLFCDILTEAIDDTFTKGADIKNGFNNCVDLLEAIVAYHKLYGGKD